MGLEAVFDIEADGLKPTKLHCLSASVNGKTHSTVSYDRMRSFLAKADVLVGHNICRFDIPNLERLLGVKVKAKLVDTLALSWYLSPNRHLHGLAEWGEDFGVPKPPIEDWENLPVEEYIHRCEQDVAINLRLWKQQWKQLLKLYGDAEKAWKLIDYLTFKMDCAREQEEVRWKLDVERTTKLRDKLVGLQEGKVKELALVMPKVPKYAKRTKPKAPYKLNKELSEAGKRWFKLLETQGLDKDYEGVVDEVVDWKEPNPGSTDQLKNWCYSLGWVPETFEYKRDKETGDVRQIPQINIKNSGGMICPSVKKLFEKEPNLSVLEGLSILTHRISVLNGFLANVDEDGYVQAQIGGLTNTLRFKHRVVVNLPGADKPYGGDIRGCLVCPEGFELVGSDMMSLEDRSKQHWMWPHDPDYVKEMQNADFDPHTALAVFAGEITAEDEKFFKHFDSLDEGQKGQSSDADKARYKKCKAVRKVYKATNYACVYGAGGPRVAITAGISDARGYKLVDTYWERNWSVRAIADECIVKTCNGSKWLYNPISELWYSLRFEKDRFSTLNQGSGVFCFDTWVSYLRTKGLKLCGQFHDEVVAVVRVGKRERVLRHFQEAMDKTNAKLKLNRELDCSIDFGVDYSCIH